MVFYPLSDKQILLTISRSIFPTNPSCLLHCFERLMDYIEEPYENYLMIGNLIQIDIISYCFNSHSLDVNTNSPLPLGMRIRSNIFSTEPYFFITKKH